MGGTTMEDMQGMEEISLRELIEVLLKRKELIAIITAVSIFLAGIVSFFILDPVYETKMVLMASNFSERLQSNDLNGEGIDNILNAISKQPQMTLETYRQQITAPRVMRETISDLGLEEEYDVEKLAKDITLETIKDTNLITIKMQHNDSEKAAEIVNKVGENFVEFVSLKAKEQATRASTYVESQMAIEKEKLDEELLKLKEFLSQPRGTSELGNELSARLAQVTAFKTRLVDLEIQKEALTAAIAEAETVAPNADKLMVKPNNIINGNGSSSYIMLESSVQVLKIEKAQVDANIKSTKTKIAETQKLIETLQIELEEKRHQERLLNQNVNIAQNTFDAFVKKYEELRVTESSQIGDATITVISKAYPTTNPIAPKKAMNVAIAAVLGLMIGVFVAFFMEYWKATESQVQK